MVKDFKLQLQRRVAAFLGVECLLLCAGTLVVPAQR